jgi:4-diphosphocytidyl-2-C-methyl-D-erythritol kinase
MVLFPNCKINLGLHITGKREDGYHNLETVFFPVPLTDILEIVSSAKTELTITGNDPGGPLEDNSCLQAYFLLKRDFPQLPEVKIHLHKTIPPGGGLGGGSADASFTLKLLNEKYQLKLSTSQLIGYSLQLGSDCPFFIINKPCLASGRGEILEEILIDLTAYKIFLINPGIPIHTGWAFTKIVPSRSPKKIQEIIRQPVETWKGELNNDFEKTVFKEYPEIKSIKDTLYSSGAIYASMSGSGSSVFGIYSKSDIVNLSFPKHYFVKELIISG